jgi:hypothetical protein
MRDLIQLANEFRDEVRGFNLNLRVLYGRFFKLNHNGLAKQSFYGLAIDIDTLQENP